MAAHSAIKNAQHKAWMRAIKRGYTYGIMPTTSTDHLHMCDNHFNSSLFIIENDQSCLNRGASPTMCLEKFNIANQGHEETPGLPRIVGRKDDSVIVNECSENIRVSEVISSPHMCHDSTISREEKSKKRVADAETRTLDCESKMKINNMGTFMHIFFRVSNEWIVKIINFDEAKLI